MTNSENGCNSSGVGLREDEIAANKRTATVFNEEERKLRALAGQWKTPPMPAYSTAYAPSTQAPPPQSMQQQQAPPGTTSDPGMMTSFPTPTNLPDNSEEYAKALQEAYRKGAEAAARMAQQQQQQQIPTAASCPNFTTDSQQFTVQSSAIGVSPVDEATRYHLDHQIHPPPQNQKQTVSCAIPDPLSSSMPPPAPQPAHPHLTTATYAQPPATMKSVASAQQTHSHAVPSQSTLGPAQPSLAGVTASVAARAPLPPEAPNKKPGVYLCMHDLYGFAAQAE